MFLQSVLFKDLSRIKLYFVFAMYGQYVYIGCAKYDSIMILITLWLQSVDTFKNRVIEILTLYKQSIISLLCKVWNSFESTCTLSRQILWCHDDATYRQYKKTHIGSLRYYNTLNCTYVGLYHFAPFLHCSLDAFCIKRSSIWLGMASKRLWLGGIRGETVGQESVVDALLTSLFYIFWEMDVTIFYNAF